MPHPTEITFGDMRASDGAPPQSVAKVLWEVRDGAGTARRPVIRIFAARKSVVAVTAKAIRNTSANELRRECKGKHRGRLAIPPQIGGTLLMVTLLPHRTVPRRTIT